MYAEKQFAASNVGPSAFASIPTNGPGVLEVEMNGMANCIELLSGAVTALESEMRNVLRPEPPQPAPAPSAQQLTSVAPAPSPIVLEVQRQRSRIDALTSLVDRLRERLEA